MLLWVGLPTYGEDSTNGPALPARPPLSESVSAVIAKPGICEPEDVIANRLDPWHGSWFHPYAFSHLVVDDDESDEHHLVVDVTTMEYDSEWDLILCVSVVEHVPDFRAAARRIHRALRPGGRAVIVAPMCFPYHDEPHDYWRFTVHGVRHMLSDFSTVKVRSRGPQRLPFTTLAIAQKDDLSA